MPDRFSGHKITQSSLVITGENGTSIAIPFSEASKLLSAVQRLTGEEPRQDSARQRTRSMSRTLWYG